MKVAFCHHLSLSYYGGGEKWIVAVATELARRGYDVEIYALPFLLEGKPKVKPKEILNDIPYSEKVHHKVKADVVYVTYHPLNWLNFETSRPRIAGIHAQSYWQPINFKYGWKPNLANVLHKTCGFFELKRFDAVHMVTSAYRVNHPRVYYIPNFVDAERYKPVCDKDDVFTVAFSSRLVWQKGYDLFRETVRILRENGLEFNVKVSGGKVKEADMPKFLSSAHVSLLPSRVDTFGLAIVESLLCETPVVTTPLATHHVLGLPLIYGSSPVEFACEILRLATVWKEDRMEYLMFARQCRLQALKYDKKVIMDRLEQMLREVSYGSG